MTPQQKQEQDDLRLREEMRWRRAMKNGMPTEDDRDNQALKEAREAQKREQDEQFYARRAAAIARFKTDKIERQLQELERQIREIPQP